MKLRGGINFFENGLTTNVRAMHLQSEMLGIINGNITGFDKVGFQRKDVVVSSFAEYIGAGSNLLQRMQACAPAT